jgi:hypothetical protein
MLTTKPTLEMIEEWKRIYEAHHSDLRPNRKTGKEVDRYFREKYPCQPLEHPEFRRMVALSIMENDFSKDRRHHEIYLSDARRVAPEKRKTVIRHPIRKKGD